MGAFGFDTQKLLWFCTTSIVILLIANHSGSHVAADSKVDSDLIFDSLEQSNLEKHHHHHRISRKPSSSSNEEPLDHSSQPHWLLHTVDRIKRSIGNLFNNQKSDEKVATPTTQRQVVKRQNDLGQQEAADDYEDEDGEDEDNFDHGNDNGFDDNEVRVDGDDEDFTNSGSGEVDGDSTLPTVVESEYHLYFRFKFTLMEPFVESYSDRNSNEFRDLSSRVRRSIEDLYQNTPGEQTATVISIEKDKSDPFKIHVTLDLDSHKNSNRENIIDVIKSNIQDNHRIGNFTASPEGFVSSTFEVPIPSCQSTQVPCRSGECISISARCDGFNDCRDGSDEDGCPDTEVPAPTLEPDSGSGDSEPDRSIPISKCRADDVASCSDKRQTICADQVCDGHADCLDGSDELNCTTASTDCATGEFMCDLTRCIPLSKRCDGTSDCSDGTDELDCQHCDPTELTCDSNKCIQHEKICDRISDCIDGADEQGCPPIEACRHDEFSCGDGQCIPNYLRCNRQQECRNGYDEVNCNNATGCTEDEFRCGSGRCIPLASKCNRNYDCEDNSDEKNCPCLPTDFKCNNGFCIPQSQRCDGTTNCQDQSDEIGCSTTKCQSWQWQCDDGTCIDRMHRCNLVPNCPDRSDEIGCNACKTDQFRCNDGSCLALDKRCDGIADCPHSEDEESCANCKNDQYRCLNGDCINGRDRCNGVVDCADGSDERDCQGKHLVCIERTWKCHDNSSCIRTSFVCDGFPDCQDKSDEQNCNLPTYTAPPQNFEEEDTCGADHVKCSDGSCIYGKKCDRTYDCSDGSDEQGCSFCGSFEFRCDNGQCIDGFLKCNGNFDCPDGSDEKECAACEADKFDCGGGTCIPNILVCDGYTDCDNQKDEENCPQCKEDEFHCDERKCIPSSQRCDTYNDCDDGTDEANCQRACSSREFRCNDGTCLPIEAQCNRNPECPDSSDELDCECRSHEFTCLNGKCIDSNLRCNRHYDCTDGSDESNCPTQPPPFVPTEAARCPADQKLCQDGSKCIYYSQLCDGRVDCFDSSDENNCASQPDALNLKTYPSSQDIKENIYKPDREVVFRCRDEGNLHARVHWIRPNGQDLPPGSRDMNGRLEIPNIKVEHAGEYICQAIGYPAHAPGVQVSVHLKVEKWGPPPTPAPIACGLFEATCSNGNCIPKQLVCDGKNDCGDGSDELRCNPHGCEPNEYRCSNKKCITKTWVCDGFDDCTDNSDEQSCSAGSPDALCKPHQFACHNQNQCIPKSYHCDLQPDCVDSSDEIGCSKPVIQRPPPPLKELLPGESFIIECRAVGVPTPEIVWRRNWGHIPSKCTTSSQDGFGILTCPNIQVEDQGAYSCEALNAKGATFAVPDTILIVKQTSVCRPGYFNTAASTESECIKCFCFGSTTECRSADLYIYQFQPPFDSLKLLGVQIDQRTGSVEIRDEPIYRNTQPQLTPVGHNGVHSQLPQGGELDQPNVVPYFAMPESYHDNQLKSYGGYLRYTVFHTNRGQHVPGPDVILTGNGYTLIHQTRRTPNPYTDELQSVRFFVGEWLRRSNSGPETLATREEIMMVLADVNNILIKLQYNHGELNTTIRNIEMDSAATPDSNLGAASYVEECTCPVGYSGNSCEKCDDGYVRQKSGPWLGQCYKETRTCSPGTYFDGRDCQICPCPLTNPGNQFGRTCSMHPDGDVICDCPQGYVGRRCESCAIGFTGNPMIPGDQCRPEESSCNVHGSLTTGVDAGGRCRCKDLTDGPSCNYCKVNTFHLSRENQFGCIACFCMGVTNECSSSDWYRDQISSVFTSSLNDFKIVDLDTEVPLVEGLRLNQESREISYSHFPSANVYYWSLPTRYLGNKLTAYGGYLKYTVKSTPIPGGQSSRNAAADIQLISANKIDLMYFAREQPSHANNSQTFVVPLFEQYWQRLDGQQADREHFLMALADVSAIYIKATYYTNSLEASLSSVTLDIANERNTGFSERALAVEQCHCPPGYKGLSCEDCDFGYTRGDQGIYLNNCQRCDCNGNSNECDPETGVCFNCRNFTTGENCEECLPEYEGDPTSGSPCQYRGSILDCRCNPDGSISTVCHNRHCECKANVEGINCDRCRPGTFGLRRNNSDGCEPCFCSGISNQCRDANLFTEQIPIQIIDANEFSLTDQYQQTRVSTGFNVDIGRNEISYHFQPNNRENLFWSLPSIFTGNKLTSYGGRIEFVHQYEETPRGYYVPDQDIIIKGNELAISWTNPSQQLPNAPNKISVPLHPSANWYRVDANTGRRPASREDILIVLANIESILVRATVSSDTTSAHLSDITLDNGVEINTGLGQATSVELCGCPQGYRGSSCESCSSGYYRDLYFDETKPLGVCTRCPCNSRESSCNTGPDRRVVCNCLPGYSGAFCELTSDDTVVTPTYPPIHPPSPPTIEVTIKTPQIEIFEVGGTVRYNCSARSLIAPRLVRVYWSKDGGELPRHAVDDGRGLLVITNLRVADSGRYICNADDGYAIQTSSTILHVAARNEVPPRIAISNPYTDISEGQLIEVTCAASGVPTPNLRIERVDGQNLNPHHYFENGRFRIDQASQSDAGEYRCIADNSAGSDAKEFRVDVRGSVAPIFRVDIQPSYYNGNSDDTVTLRCLASGNIRSIDWSKESGEFPYNSRKNNDVLMIHRARPEDSGVYVCTVRLNSGAIGSQRATVNIAGSNDGTPPSVMVTPERATISQGTTIELKCDASGSPLPTVKWTRRGSEFGPNIEQIGSVLYIRNAKIEDRGMYICVASNDVAIGQGYATVDVTRLEGPILEIYPKETQTVTAGNSAILQCRAIAGEPSPKITWSRGLGMPMTQNIEQMSGGSLRFTSISPNEEGEYICTAVNEAGKAEAVAHIVVHTTPDIYITPGLDVINKNVNEPLRLECQGTGTPQPSVVWSKYGQQQLRRDFGLQYASTSPSNVAVHEIIRLTKEDEGVYVCTAQNSAGVSEKRIQLIVDTLPERGDITGEDATSGTTGSGYKDNEVRPYVPGGGIHREIDEEFTTPIGTRAELRCRIDNEQGNVFVNWVRADNSTLPPNAFVRGGVLYIDNAQPSAAGVYKCLGADQNTGAVMFSLNTRLLVISPPRISISPPRQIVHPGDNAQIQCSATGEAPITITWLPINRELPSTVYTRDGLIQFNNIQLKDAGRYLCTATNAVGSADSTADVIVQENVHQPRNDNELKVAPLGSTISLNCRTQQQVRDNDVRWFREHLPLPRDSRVNGPILHIFNVRKEDAGRYYCEVSTVEGITGDHVDLQVLDQVQPKSGLELHPTLHITPSAEQKRQVGESFDVVCQSNEPGVITAWSKLSGWLEKNVQDVGGTLRFSDVRAENGGLYRCEATGRQGVYHKDFDLEVLDAVKDDIPVQVKTARRGTRVILECHSDLEAPVNYVWTKQGGKLPRNIDIFAQSIELENIGSSDAGTYSCQTSNSHRKLDVPIILVVTGIVPYFTQAPNSFIALPTLPDAYIEFSIEISFKPEKGDGLILYNSKRGNAKNNDFIALSLDNSVPEFRMNLGHSTTLVRADNPIANREWHTIKITRNKKKIIMYVDSEGPFIGHADGKFIGLDLDENLFLASVPDFAVVHPDLPTTKGFVGCISRLKIGHSFLDILREAINKVGTTTCETCSENKCQNQGACQEALSKEGYTCICPSGFSGATCNKMKGEACVPQVCNSGRCVDTESSFVCKCPLGYSGERCERQITINEPAFQNDAYIAYPTPKPSRRLKISLKVKPKDTSDGVLLYCGETDEGHGDYISLAIRDRHLEFRFNPGNGPTVIRHPKLVVPDEWIALTASRSLSDGRLMVNGETPVLGRLAGNHKSLNLNTPLYVGGFDKDTVKINHEVNVEQGFTGCLSDINVSGLNINLLQSINDSSNVEDCDGEDETLNNIYVPSEDKAINYDSRRTGCSSNPCQNSGTCYPTSPMDYQCSCLPDFSGRNCEQEMDDSCTNNPCENGAECRSVGRKFVCDCPLGYTGEKCDQRTEIRGDANFNGNGYLEFSRNLLDNAKEDNEVIALEFSTKSPNGLIFWHGQDPFKDGQGDDYISLGVQDGILEFSYDLGSGPAIIRIEEVRIDNGQRHTIILKRDGKIGSIELDHLYTKDGESDGLTSMINCEGNIYLGGTPNVTLMSSGRFTQGFNGCIHGFELQNSKSIDLGAKAINGLNVKPCSSNDDDALLDNGLIN